MRIAAAIWLSVASLWAQSGLDRPTLGKMLDANGTTRTVYGVAGSATLGDPEIEGVLSTACSRQLCLAKTDTSILSSGQAIDAPPGPALFALHGDAGIIYFPQTRQLARWRDNQLDFVDVDVDGEVLSLRPAHGTLEFAVRREDGRWIVRGGNEIVDWIPGATGPVMLLENGLVYGTEDALVLRRPDGSEIRFDATGIDDFVTLGEGYVQVRGAKTDFLLRVDSGREQMSLLPRAAGAPLILVSFDGGVETPVGNIFDYGNVATGDTKDVRFRARNTGNSLVVLTTLTVIGAGFFKISAPSLPYTIAPGNFLEFTVRFISGTQPGLVYSANLQVNGISAALTATSVPAATLGVSSDCTSGGTVDFGRVQIGTSRSCNFTLSNPSTQSIFVPALSVTGTGFQGPQGLSAPFTLAASDTVAFSITFTPPASPPVSKGTLTVGPQTFPLIGSGFVAPFPKPTLQFDSTQIGSNQQPTLTMMLPAPSPVTTSGTVTLTFTPVTPLVADDSSIRFLATGSKHVNFSVKQGDSQVLLGDRTGAVFSTGTTAGTITFTITGAQIDGAPTTTLTISPAIISFDTVTASRRVNDLDVEVIGFDNTYTAGAMSFTFFDLSGRAIDPGAIGADFTTNFRSYFSTVTAGSSFLMRVTFPVTGDATQVGSVQVDLVNSAGTAHTQQVKFQ